MDTIVARGLWARIISRLDSDMPDWRSKIEHFEQVSAVDFRLRAEVWSDDQIFRGLVRSVLSNSIDWAKIDKVLPELESTFREFDPVWYAALQPDYINDVIVPWFKDHRSGSRALRRSLQYLIKAAKLLNERSCNFGSLEGYLADLADRCSGDPKDMAMALGVPGSAYKLPSLGVTLAAEFLKNVGYDVAKPDRHVKRAMGAFRLVQFTKWPDRSGTKAPTATNAELREVMNVMEELARRVSVSSTFADNAIWLLCAESGLYMSNAQLAELRDNVS